MHDEIPLGRIAGFSVKVHWSVLVILWLFTWSLATTLPGTVKGYAPVAYWLAGAGGAAVLLASLLAHELAHAIVARRCGVPVENVTLWLFGGVTTLGGEAKTPRAAFRIAFAGPATSLALSATFGTLAVALTVIRTPSIAISVAWWLAGVNLLLGLFNLLPGAPLDGGRLVRAYLWRRHGDIVRAGIGAARAGRVVALVLIALGLAEFVAGGLVGGVWLAFIGWFIFAAAREEETRISTRQLFAGVTVADAMTPPAAYRARVDHRRGIHPALCARRPPLGLPGCRAGRIDHGFGHATAVAGAATRPPRHHQRARHRRATAGGADRGTPGAAERAARADGAGRPP